MPRFKKGSKEAKEWGAMMKAKRGKHGEGFLDEIKNIGSAVGKPFEASVGVNPFNLGYTLGHDVIAPALMRGRGEVGSLHAHLIGADPATYTPARFRAGGSVGAYQETIAQQGGQRYGNTNNGVMRVPFANTPYPIHIAGIAGRNGVPERTSSSRIMGRGVIDQLNNVGYLAQQYNQSNLGANGFVSL